MSLTVKKRERLKDEVYHLIRNDIPLRDKISAQLGITVNSVYQYARRKSPTLHKPVVLNIIEKHTGFKLNELFET